MTWFVRIIWLTARAVSDAQKKLGRQVPASNTASACRLYQIHGVRADLTPDRTFQARPRDRIHTRARVRSWAPCFRVSRCDQVCILYMQYRRACAGTLWEHIIVRNFWTPSVRTCPLSLSHRCLPADGCIQVPE